MPTVTANGAVCEACQYDWIPRMTQKFIRCPKCKHTEVL